MREKLLHTSPFHNGDLPSYAFLPWDKAMLQIQESPFNYYFWADDPSEQ